MVPRTCWSVLAVLVVFVVSTAADCADYNGITGSTSGGVEVCCDDDCQDSTCVQDEFCTERGDGCCPDTIAGSGTECGDENDAPCTLADTPDPTPAPVEPEKTEDDSSGGGNDEDSNSTEAPAPAPDVSVVGSTSDSDAPVGPIVGAVAGVLVIVAIIVAVAFKTGRFKNCRHSSTDPTPAVPVEPANDTGGSAAPPQQYPSQPSGHPTTQYPVAHQYPAAMYA